MLSKQSKNFFLVVSLNQISCNNKKKFRFRSSKHDMSSKIVGWLVGDWDGKKSDFKINLN